MDRETYEITESITYRLYLAEANKNKRAEWKIAYRFKEYYGVQRLDAKTAAKIAQEYKVPNFTN